MAVRGMLPCALALAACTQVFELEETGVAPMDRDGDDVPDDLDNCVSSANEGQGDADGDALGDACDPCPELASSDLHDEDGDGRGDACDPCPAVSDFYLDADGDGVGDACDRDARTTMRVEFDPFLRIEAPWQVVSGEWEEHGDEVGPIARLSTGNPTIAAPTVAVAGGEWVVEVGLHTTEPIDETDRIGIELIEPATGRTVVSCLASCEAMSTRCRIDMNVDGQSGVAMLPDAVQVPRSVLRLQAAPVFPQFTCVALGTRLGTTFMAPVAPLSVAVVASPRTRLRYIEVVR